MQESDKRGHVQEHGAKNEAPAAEISPEAALVLPETLDITVTREILSLATRMAAALDISVPNERWPTVRVSESAQTSSYSLEDNSITIAKKHVNSGGTYAEEVTHFLKAITMPPPENPEENIVDMDYYMAFQEMCGRLGRDFAERLCAGSELAHLFVGSNEDEGVKIAEVARKAAEKLESSQLLLAHQIRELEASAALLTNLRAEVDQILDNEWRNDTTELPQASALLKQRVSELAQSPNTPTGALPRLATIGDFVGSKDALTPHEIIQALAVLRTGANSDEFLAQRLSLQSGLMPLAIADAEIHGSGYSAAEELMRAYTDTWHEHFKKIMHLSLSDAKDPNGFLGSL